jgi:hypothetical protein
MTFEHNTVIGNKNNFYSGNAEHVIVRNNLIWAPEAQANPGTHWEKKSGNDNDWHVSSRNEGGTLPNKQNKYVQGLHNMAYYNNLFVNNSVQFNGYHNGGCSKVSGGEAVCKSYSGCSWANNKCEGRTPLHSISENIYFGHNTLVTGKDTNNNNTFDLNALFQMNFNANQAADGDAVFTGLIENNVFDISKEPKAPFNIKLSGNDKVTFRNNLLPASLESNSPLRGNGDIYYTQPQLTNALVDLNFPIPAIGAPSVDVAALRKAVNTANYHLKQSSAAVNAGNGQLPVVGAIPATKLEVAKKWDYNSFARVGVPDIGAFELGSVSGPSPTDMPSENWDLDNDGDVDAFDFNQFVLKVMKKTESWSKLASFIAAFQ